MSHGLDYYFAVLPASTSKISYNTMSTVNSARVAGTALQYTYIVTLGVLRLLTPLFHLCADGTVETKREEGGFMLYCDARVAQQRTVRAASLFVDDNCGWLAPGLDSRRLPIQPVESRTQFREPCCEGA